MNPHKGMHEKGGGAKVAIGGNREMGGDSGGVGRDPAGLSPGGAGPEAGVG